MFVLNIIYGGMLIPLLIVFVLACAAITVFSLIRAGKGGKGNKNVLAEGIKENADDFTEMFEPVYSVSIGKHDKQEEIFALWNQKVAESENDNGYKAVFEKKFGDYATWGVKETKKGAKVKEKKQNKLYKKAAKKLVKIFFKAGIVRGHEIFATGNETTAEKYELVGAGSIETERKYEVLAPFWSLKDKIVDKGVIR